ncbi:MAG: DUF2612 domain-containing protein [Desulfobacteraceae bacterium]|jgi:hypothetical protein
MPEMMQETDYPQIAFNLLIQQYKESSNLMAVLEAQGLQANELEQAIFEVRDLFFLDTAEGVQLDVIGKIFNLRREGLSDEDYRDAIEIKWSLRVSGTVDEIINVLKFAYGATSVDYIPAYPAGFVLIADGTVTQDILTQLCPAGVFGFLLDDDRCYIMDHEETLAEDSDFIVDADNYPITCYRIDIYSIVDAAGEELEDAAGDFIEAANP